MIEFPPAQLNRMDPPGLPAYRTNLDFYQGSQWPQTSRHRQLVLNYAKVSIDKITSFLMQGLGVACFPTQDTDELKARVRKAEQLLSNVHDQNAIQQLDYETEVDAAILGDGCYKVIWDPEQKRIRITSPDVSGIFAWWLGDCPTRVWRVASKYTLTQDEISILYRTAIAKNQAAITELWTPADLSLYLDDDLIA